MARRGPNHPPDKVRELQRSLYRAAKKNRKRRFHALYHRIARRDVLGEAWKRVKSNKGAGGVDRVTLSMIEQRGVPDFLVEIRHALEEGVYRPRPVRRAYIDKSDGRKRPLGIPTVKDRVVQMAAKIVLEPIFEADFQACSYFGPSAAPRKHWRYFACGATVVSAWSSTATSGASSTRSIRSA